MRVINADNVIEELGTICGEGDSLSPISKAVKQFCVDLINDQPTVDISSATSIASPGISVKDRLPTGDDRYLVWPNIHGEWEIHSFDTASQTFGDTYEDFDEMYHRLLCWDDYINKFVTHWMPLPKVPKESDAE